MAKKSFQGPQDGQKNQQPPQTGQQVRCARAHSCESLESFHPPVGSRHRKVRVGAAWAPSWAKLPGSGDKGQKSRRGYSRRRGFEGGQMPLHRRMPKRGFHNPFSVEYSILNLAELNAFPAGETVTPELLRAHGFVRRSRDRVRFSAMASSRQSLPFTRMPSARPPRKKLPRQAARLRSWRDVFGVRQSCCRFCGVNIE